MALSLTGFSLMSTRESHPTTAVHSGAQPKSVLNVSIWNLRPTKSFVGNSVTTVINETASKYPIDAR